MCSHFKMCSFEYISAVPLHTGIKISFYYQSITCTHFNLPLHISSTHFHLLPQWAGKLPPTLSPLSQNHSYCPSSIHLSKESPPPPQYKSCSPNESTPPHSPRHPIPTLLPPPLSTHSPTHSPFSEYIRHH